MKSLLIDKEGWFRWGETRNEPDHVIAVMEPIVFGGSINDVPLDSPVRKKYFLRERITFSVYVESGAKNHIRPILSRLIGIDAQMISIRGDDGDDGDG